MHNTLLHDRTCISVPIRGKIQAFRVRYNDVVTLQTARVALRAFICVHNPAGVTKLR